MRLRFLAPLLLTAAALVASPRAAHAQPHPLALEDVVQLVRAQVSPARILELARENCLAFAMDAAATARLREAGAEPEVIRGLSAPDLCRAAPPAPGTTGSTGTGTALVRRGGSGPPPEARRSRREPYGAGLSLSVGYMHVVYEADDTPGVDGSGGMVEVAYGFTPALAVFLRGDRAELGGAPVYARGLAHTDLGVRLFAGGGRWPVRPYADAALTLVNSRPDENSAYDQRTSLAGSVGAGVQLFLGTPRMALNAGVRLSPNADVEALAPFDGGRSARADLRFDWYP